MTVADTPESLRKLADELSTSPRPATQDMWSTMVCYTLDGAVSTLRRAADRFEAAADTPDALAAARRAGAEEMREAAANVAQHAAHTWWGREDTATITNMLDVKRDTRALPLPGDPR